MELRIVGMIEMSITLVGSFSIPDVIIFKIAKVMSRMTNLSNIPTISDQVQVILYHSLQQTTKANIARYEEASAN